MDEKHKLWELRSMQAAPLSVKISLTRDRIRQWINEFGEDGVYVSFSGGKDSTVLLDIVRKDYPNVPAVYCDTGLEYPEVRDFVKTFDNVTILKPKMNFKEVVNKYGFPFISKEVSECVYGARRYLESINGGEYPRELTAELIAKVDELACRNLRGGVRQQMEKAQGDGLLQQTRGTSQKEFPQRWRQVKGIGEYRAGVDFHTMVQNVRVQRALGILPKKGLADLDSLPGYKDRSQYSCARYQFFLEAPFEIGQRCCKVMKKDPFHRYQRETGRKAMTAQMAEESRLRLQSWIKYGCNAFNTKDPKSNPMMFWTEQDVLQYIKEKHLPIASVYGEIVRDTEVAGQMNLFDYGLSEESDLLKTTGCNRTGCMFCLYGIHLEDHPNRLEMLKNTHPKIYEYIMKPEEEGGLGYKEKIDWVNEHGNMDIKY